MGKTTRHTKKCCYKYMDSVLDDDFCSPTIIMAIGQNVVCEKNSAMHLYVA